MLCKPALFNTEIGVNVEIIGLEDERCVINVISSESGIFPFALISGVNPTYEMTCKIENYRLGITDPNLDIPLSCEESIVKLISYLSSS